MNNSTLIQTDPETVEKSHEDSHDLDKRPSTGRTSNLGRRVEKPHDCNPGGPSGQHQSSDHEKQHANK